MRRLWPVALWLALVGATQQALTLRVSAHVIAPEARRAAVHASDAALRVALQVPALVAPPPAPAPDAPSPVPPVVPIPRQPLRPEHMPAEPARPAPDAAPAAPPTQAPSLVPVPRDAAPPTRTLDPMQARRHLGVACLAHQLDVVDECRAVGPLIGPRQGRHAARRLESEGVARLAVVECRAQVFELRRQEAPVVEHLLEAAGDGTGIVGRWRDRARRRPAGHRANRPCKWRASSSVLRNRVSCKSGTHCRCRPPRSGKQGRPGGTAGRSSPACCWSRCCMGCC